MERFMTEPKRRTAFALSVLSGLLTAAAFPPFGVWPLALIGLMPLLWIWRSAEIWRGAWTGFVFGVCFFGVLLSWSWYFGAVAIVPLVGAQALYIAAVGVSVATLKKWGVTSPLIVASMWTLSEYLRGSWPLGGLAWGEVGTSLSPLAPARGLAGWAGALGVSFAVVLLQCIVLEVLLKNRESVASEPVGEGRGLRYTSFSIPIVVLLICLTLGLYAPKTQNIGSMRVATLQGNDLNRRLTLSEIDNGVLTEKHLGLAKQLRGKYDLIIFPESALMSDPEADSLLRSEIIAIAKSHESFVLINAINREKKGKIYNTNRLYSPSGLLVANYSKTHLVPFGEYVPWRSALSFISAIEQVPEDFTPGTKDESNASIFNLRGRQVGSLICFESVFPEIARDQVRSGAELLVVSTNNRSYRRSGNSAQHVQSSQMRASETGRAVIQASISGISAVILPDGRIIKKTDLFRPAIIKANVPLQAGETPYVKHGPIVVKICFLIMIAAVALGVKRHRLTVMPNRGDSSE